FSLNPPILDLPVNDQPYSPYAGPLVPYQNVRAFNETTIDRFMAFAQWSRKSMLGNHELWLNAGLRAQSWNVSDRNGSSGQMVWSPRAQVSFKPDWNRDVLFRLSGGMYHQPPGYRELRHRNWNVNPQVKAQQSVPVLLGSDYSFKMWDRPF